MVRDPSMVSVPTYQIMLNASAKTAMEWVMQKGLSKAFGTTALDKMTFGQTWGQSIRGNNLCKSKQKSFTRCGTRRSRRIITGL